MAKSWNARWRNVGKENMQGGQGRIFFVVDHLSTEKNPFALKELVNPKRKDRFVQEIQAIRRLPPHPNIISIVDSGIVTQDNSYYYVMELASGTFDQYLFSIDYEFDSTLKCFLQVLDGVKHIHDNSIIHRDLKPANILMFAKAVPKIADFGLSLMTDCDDRMTPTSEAVGPRYYMAPELEDGRNLDVDARADIYSLGKILYFCLSKGEVFAREKHNSPRYNLEKRYGDSRFALFTPILDRTIAERPSGRFESIDMFRSSLLDAMSRYKSHPLSTLDSSLRLSTYVSDPESLLRIDTSIDEFSAAIEYLRNQGVSPGINWLEAVVSRPSTSRVRRHIVAMIEQSIDALSAEQRLRILRLLAANDDLASSTLSLLNPGLTNKFLVPAIKDLDSKDLNALISHIALFVHNYPDLLPLLLKRIGDLDAKTAALVLVSAEKASLEDKYGFYKSLLNSYDNKSDEELLLYEAILMGFLGSMPSSQIEELYKLFALVSEANRAQLIRALAHASQINPELFRNIDKVLVDDSLLRLFLFELLPKVNEDEHNKSLELSHRVRL